MAYVSVTSKHHHTEEYYVCKRVYFYVWCLLTPVKDILGMALFFRVHIFVDRTKLTRLWESKSFKINTENRFFLGTRFRGSDPLRKPRKFVPHEN